LASLLRRILPSDGCCSSVKKPTSLRCGSVIRSSIGVVARRRHIELVEQLDPFVGRLVAEAGRLDLEVGGGVPGARRGAVEARIGLELGRPIASKKAKACTLVLGRTVT
jgi:hypothetical protein